ncbi:ABC transporter substrate-binding protein [Paenibacillus methanolicus]|uniref:Putative aldouronate transport system substrate-binding protein n=1 Tax=Paenibacillus methanolicus TaxID=582686 RepID=A0A5S5CEB8_9BACL|nr:ABC transporter substrate-binding protein [Paenibacillus methanolicus]TYP77489.1 putative aldouronate transport system substrate-binding protein [Paenibacillus methanolicus]
MKRKMQLALSLMLALVFVFVTACGNSNNEGGNNTATPETNATNATNATNEPAAEPITIRMATGNNPNWDDMQSDIGKFIKEKTGITIKPEFPVGGSSDDAFALMIASDEYPDLVVPGSSTNKMVDAGAMIDLRPLIEEHAPNIKKVYGEYYNRLRWSKDDDGIYTLSLTGVDHTYFDSGSGFQLQHQVLKAAGYPKIKTVQDYEAAIKAYMEKNPKTADGQPNIGLSLNGGEWQILISVTNPAFLATGAPDDGEFFINQDTYEAIMHYQRPEEREYFRWLNHMNDIGLLDPESFVQKYDQYKAKIASGRVLGLIDQQWDYGQAESALKAEGKFASTYARFPVTLNETYQDHTFASTGYLPALGIGITKDAQDPVRLIKFLDYLASDEGQVLLNWGIEGKHYNVVDGKRVIPADVQEQKTNDNNTFVKTTGIGNYNLSARYGDGVKDPSGNYYTTTFPEQIQTAYSEEDKKTLAAYGATTYKDLWPSDDAFPERKYGAAWTLQFETGSKENVIFQKTQDIMKKRIPEAILAKPEDFDKIYDQFLKDLEDAGVAKMNEEFTKMVKARVELWSK